jgi:hypothetical protein
LSLLHAEEHFNLLLLVRVNKDIVVAALDAHLQQCTSKNSQITQSQKEKALPLKVILASFQSRSVHVGGGVYTNTSH